MSGFARTLFLCASAALLPAAIIDSVNENASNLSSPFGPEETGWVYQPGFTYDLNGIETRYGTGGVARTVTVEIYSAHPGAGGTLLRSGAFTSSPNAWVGASFAALTLNAGQSYFVGFRNVAGLQANVTADVGATALPGGIWYSTLNSGTYSVNQPLYGGTAILRFNGDAVPEPATLAVTGLAFAALLTAERATAGRVTAGRRGSPRCQTRRVL